MGNRNIGIGDIIPKTHWMLLEATSLASPKGDMRYIMACQYIRDGKHCDAKVEQTRRQADNARMCKACGLASGTLPGKGKAPHRDLKLTRKEQGYLVKTVARHLAACKQNGLPVSDTERAAVVREALEFIEKGRKNGYADILGTLAPAPRDRETYYTTPLGQAIRDGNPNEVSMHGKRKAA